MVNKTFSSRNVVAVCAYIVVLMGVAVQTFAQTTGVAKTVEDLIRLDAQEALKDAKQKNAPAVPSMNTMPPNTFGGVSTTAKSAELSKKAVDKPKSDDLILVHAVFGYGDALKAVLSLNNQTKTVVKTGDAFANYRVTGIQGRCVELQSTLAKSELSKSKCYAPKPTNLPTPMRATNQWSPPSLNNTGLIPSVPVGTSAATVPAAFNSTQANANQPRTVQATSPLTAALPSPFSSPSLSPISNQLPNPIGSNQSLSAPISIGGTQ